MASLIPPTRVSARRSYKHKQKNFYTPVETKSVMQLSPAETEALSAFLGEMEQLELWLSQSLEGEEDDDTFTCQAPAAFCGGLTRKKKISSTERMKREKTLLQTRIKILQCELRRVRDANQQHLSQDVVTKSRLRNLRLRRLHTSELSRAETVATLVRQLVASMKQVTYSMAISGIRLDSARDTSMYQMLDQGIRQKYGRLIQSWQQGYLPLLTEETVDTVVSLDGSTISSIIVRFMPFDIATVSETAWNTRQTQSDENCRRTLYKKDANVLAVKEELRQANATLCIHKLIKFLRYERYSAFVWEVNYEWSPAGNPETSITSQESGWSLNLPVDYDGPLTAVQSFMKMTSTKDNKAWMQLTRKPDTAAQTIGPSFQQIMQDRMQFVENRLMDEAMQAPRQ